MEDITKTQSGWSYKQQPRVAAPAPEVLERGRELLGRLREASSQSREEYIEQSYPAPSVSAGRTETREAQRREFQEIRDEIAAEFERVSRRAIDFNLSVLGLYENPDSLLVELPALLMIDGLLSMYTPDVIRGMLTSPDRDRLPDRKSEEPKQRLGSRAQRAFSLDEEV